MNRSPAHTRLCNAILIALSKLPRVVASLNPSGTADYPGGDRVAYGAFGPGAPDILATCSGRLLCVEVKTGRAKQSPEQRRCQRRMAYARTPYVVARRVGDAVQAAQRVLEAAAT